MTTDIQTANLGASVTIEAVKVTEAAAIAAYDLVGRGDEDAADDAAVNAMRSALGNLNIDGTVVIGEGERDKAPMLYVGEKVGTGHGPKMSIALDPLEGTSICANGRNGAMSVIAMSESGGLLNAPDVYMEKIAIGIKHPSHIIDLDNTPKQNLMNLAKVKKCGIDELSVVILNRPRHAELIAKVREAGARIVLISDGDIAAVIATSLEKELGDMYMGIGGAPEGVLAAAALASLGGQIMGRLLFDDDLQRDRARSMGISDLNRKYTTLDLASGEDVIFAATGVTNGSMLRGVRIQKPEHRILTHSIVMSSQQRVVRHIYTTHQLNGI
jgi:fructose-1,6-bisphosphatase II / sedoheptulose-1,7-bisphosphatase